MEKIKLSKSIVINTPSDPTNVTKTKDLIKLKTFIQKIKTNVKSLKIRIKKRKTLKNTQRKKQRQIILTWFQYNNQARKFRNPKARNLISRYIKSTRDQHKKEIIRHKHHQILYWMLYYKSFFKIFTKLNKLTYSEANFLFNKRKNLLRFFVGKGKTTFQIFEKDPIALFNQHYNILKIFSYLPYTQNLLHWQPRDYKEFDHLFMKTFKVVQNKATRAVLKTSFQKKILNRNFFSRKSKLHRKFELSHIFRTVKFSKWLKNYLLINRIYEYNWVNFIRRRIFFKKVVRNLQLKLMDQMGKDQPEWFLLMKKKAFQKKIFKKNLKISQWSNKQK